VRPLKASRHKEERMSSQPTIRYAQIEDLEGITEIYNHYILTSHATFDVKPYTTEERKPWFMEHSSGGRHTLFVAEDPETGMIIGYACSSSFRPKAAYTDSVETSIYIHPDYTRRHIAAKLYTRLIDSLEQSGVHRIYACLAVPNEPSKRLHERLGFVQVGLFTEAGYKLGSYRDIMWFEKRLP
jgi:phosphinothricin acetyltransferase